MATRVLLTGAQFRVNINTGGGNGVDGDQIFPQAATLTDGRIAVVYQTDLAGGTETDPIAAVIGSIGSLDVFNFSNHQDEPVVAARLDGGVGVAFTNERHADATLDANGPNITYRPVTSAGTLGTALAIGDLNGGAGHDALSNPA